MTAITSLADFITADFKSIVKVGSPLDILFEAFAHPAVPFISIVAYLLLSTPFFNAVRRLFNIQPKGTALQLLTVTHSAILAVYSGWTFLGAIKIVVPYVTQHGLYPSLCDANGDLWHKQGLGFWITHFYLSKYYEFIDTWIVLLKGRNPIFLQTYHHAGIVIFMWGFVITANTCGGLITTVFNSFIHTLMYTYYTLAALGYSSPLKHYLTQAQITQFVVGILLTVPSYFIPGCVNSAQSLVLGGIHLYCVVLIWLFYQFYVDSYSKKKNPKEKGDSADKIGNQQSGKKSD